MTMPFTEKEFFAALDDMLAVLPPPQQAMLLEQMNRRWVADNRLSMDIYNFLSQWHGDKMARLLWYQAVLTARQGPGQDVPQIIAGFSPEQHPELMRMVGVFSQVTKAVGQENPQVSVDHARRVLEEEMLLPQPQPERKEEEPPEHLERS